MSSEPAILLPAVHALRAILAPLEYSSLYIPYLPATLLAPSDAQVPRLRLHAAPPLACPSACISPAHLHAPDRCSSRTRCHPDTDPNPNRQVLLSDSTSPYLVGTHVSLQQTIAAEGGTISTEVVLAHIDRGELARTLTLTLTLGLSLIRSSSPTSTVARSSHAPRRPPTSFRRLSRASG